MENLYAILTKTIEYKILYKCVISNPRNKSNTYKKIEINPVNIKNTAYYQISISHDNKISHKNVLPQHVIKEIEGFVPNFKQINIFSDYDYQIFINSKGGLTIIKNSPSIKTVTMSHDRKKNYQIAEGKPVDFLVELGVMTKDGKVVKSKYDKFRQINKYVEIIRDCIYYLPKDKQINIVDFGCGKSYLTFALYYYLKKLNNLPINIIGLDLKKDVIGNCNTLAEKLQWENIKFLSGDIDSFQNTEQIHMVISLHACDTATDKALAKAINWNSPIILAVPCCQHELFSQIDNNLLAPMLKHGIIKERFSSLATDASRAIILELLGYKTQILEFIDMEHTPKNLMIRAIYSGEKHTKDSPKYHEYTSFKNFLNISPHLELVLKDYN